MRDTQIKEMNEEIRALNDHIKSLKQKNLELFHKNNELEESLRAYESREGPGKSEYINRTFDIHDTGEGRLGIEKDLTFWKDKCETLVRKYMNALRNLKEENERLKNDLLDEVDDLRTETETGFKSIKRQYKNVRVKFLKGNNCLIEAKRAGGKECS